MGLSQAKAFPEGCGYLGFTVTVAADGAISGATVPAGADVDSAAIKGAFDAAGITPETGTYTFELYTEGTRLAYAPSVQACTLAAGLEKAVDAGITQPLLARLRAAQKSALPSDVGNGAHGSGLHGETPFGG